MTEREWEAIKAEYVAGLGSYRQLATSHGVSLDSLEKRAWREGGAVARRQAGGRQAARWRRICRAWWRARPILLLTLMAAFGLASGCKTMYQNAIPVLHVDGPATASVGQAVTVEMIAGARNGPEDFGEPYVYLSSPSTYVVGVNYGAPFGLTFARRPTLRKFQVYFTPTEPGTYTIHALWFQRPYDFPDFTSTFGIEQGVENFTVHVR